MSNLHQILAPFNSFHTSSSKPQQVEDNDEDVAVLEIGQNSIVVWNDEVNTFDWVIESLVDLCDHSFESAEQCAMIIHYNGKYAVKKGTFEDLRPRCEALIDRGISATIQ